MWTQDLDSFLLDPRSYPEEGHEVEVHETHISQVYLVGQHAYKRKKALRLPFLDYSTLELREEAAYQELAVNTPFAAGVYEGLNWVYRRADGMLTWSPTAEKVEVLVRMRRFRARDQLDLRLERGPLTEEESQRLKKSLHRLLTKSAKLAMLPGAYVRLIEGHVRENKSSLETLAHELDLDCAVWAKIFHRQLLFLRLCPELFQERVAEGWVRLGHGDLKPEHIILEKEPYLVDAIEFDPQLRTLDLADEVSFLEVELHALGYKEFGEDLRKELELAREDHVPDALSAFYRSYRASVRAKVLSFRAQQQAGEARLQLLQKIEIYQKLAEDALSLMLPPVILFVAGPMGSGKSYLARHLAEDLGVTPMESDLIRRELFGAPESLLGYGEGRYTDDARLLVYRELLRRMEEALAAGWSPILDASFSSPEFWHVFAEHAALQSYPYLMVVCRCSDALALERIESRRQSGVASSDARPELYSKQVAACRWEFDPSYAMHLETQQPLGRLMEQVYAAIAQRWRDFIAGNRGEQKWKW